MEKKKKRKTAILWLEVLAGKTEAAQTLTVLNSNLCVIDADKFRVLFQVMLGIIQMNSTRIITLVDAALDLVLKRL